MTHPLHTLGGRVLAAGNNPFNGIVPNFSIFGADFTAWWQKLLAGLWGIAIVFCAFKLFPAALSAHSARRDGRPVQLKTSTEELQTWGLATGVIFGAGILFGAVVAVTS